LKWDAGVGTGNAVEHLEEIARVVKVAIDDLRAVYDHLEAKFMRLSKCYDRLQRDT
jgi:hypothetical protein